ncbi:MAG: hypothetical protein ACTHMS_11000 [Jatrophihabitans sp.]|uniref:hypothetical protein n=1 Tax=Jatrophihabitans sp. TaxID=1932789 RepID=UPI003F7DB17F
MSAVAASGAAARRRVTSPEPDIAWHVVAMCAGLLLVAVADALARTGHAGGTALFWLGEIVVITPMAALAVTPARSPRRFAVAVGAFAVVTASTRWLYSPARFAFPDELQHLLATQNLLAQGRFGIANPALPIESSYPGLPVVGGLLARLTGLGVEPAGIVVGAACHVGTVLLVAAVLTRLLPDTRAAAVGVVVYAANPGLARFMAFYVYENLALVFASFAVVCALTLPGVADVRRRRALFAAAAVASLATAITHHVTSIVLPLAFGACALWARRSRSAAAARPVVILAVTSGLVTLVWLAAVARGTWAYLQPYTVQLGAARATPQRLRGDGVRAVLPSTPPLWELLLGAAGFVALLVACTWAAVATWRAGRRWHAVLPAVAALGLAVLAAARVLSPRGSELTGRSGPFLYVPVALAVAGLVGAAATAGRRRSVSAAVLVAVVLAGVCISWPVFWERLPGGSPAATVFERGVDARIVAAAEWVGRHTPTGSRVAADDNGLVEVETRAHRDAVPGLADVFYRATLDDRVLGELRSNRVDYVWVDRLLSRAPAADDLYYGGDGVRYTTAPTAAALAKFDAATAVDCVFDNGEIAIYDVRGLVRG